MFLPDTNNKHINYIDFYDFLFMFKDCCDDNYLTYITYLSFIHKPDKFKLKIMETR